MVNIRQVIRVMGIWQGIDAWRIIREDKERRLKKVVVLGGT